MSRLHLTCLSKATHAGAWLPMPFGYTLDFGFGLPPGNCSPPMQYEYKHFRGTGNVKIRRNFEKNKNM